MERVVLGQMREERQMNPLGFKLEEWIKEEVTGAELGDKRRTERLKKMAVALAKDPRGTIHGSLLTWREAKGAYRLLNRAEVTHTAVLKPHWQRTLERCRNSSEVLLLEDTTSLNYQSHPATKGLGRIGDDRNQGLYVHSTLALQINGWSETQEPEGVLLGMFGQHCWARTRPTIGVGKERKQKRLQRPRESQRWAAVLAKQGEPPPDVRWTLVADREGDIYEVLRQCRAHKFDFIIRSNQARALEGQAGSVFSAVAAERELGRFTIELRARPGQPARRANLAVRATTIKLRAPYRPGCKLEPLELNVVEAREVGAPAEVKEPIVWVLLTSWPVTTFTDALRVVKAYACRWLIEEYHKALKTGVGIEKSQLQEARKLMALTGILSLVAIWLLNLKLPAQTNPTQPLSKDDLPSEVLEVLVHKGLLPSNGCTQLMVLTAIARLGGFLGRKHDGTPGWQILWRGWKVLALLTEGFRFRPPDLRQECFS
jgi:hypothetical protein